MSYFIPYKLSYILIPKFLTWHQYFYGIRVVVCILVWYFSGFWDACWYCYFGHKIGLRQDRKKYKTYLEFWGRQLSDYTIVGAFLLMITDIKRIFFNFGYLRQFWSILDEQIYNQWNVKNHILPWRARYYDSKTLFIFILSYL